MPKVKHLYYEEPEVMEHIKLQKNQSDWTRKATKKQMIYDRKNAENKTVKK